MKVILARWKDVIGIRMAQGPQKGADMILVNKIVSVCLSVPHPTKYL